MKKHLHITVASCLASAILFIIVSLAVLRGDFAASFDAMIANFINLHISDSFTGLMLFITNLASPLVLTTLFVVVYFVLIWNRHGYYDMVMISSVLVGLIITFGLKWFIDMPRPEGMLVYPWGSSFPSGHVVMATIFFLVTAYAFRHELEQPIPGWFLECVAFALIVLIGVSRIFLGAHRPSEVVAGFLVGAFSVSASLVLLHRLDYSIRLKKAA